MTDELPLLRGTLDVLILRALAWRPLHGHAIARFIHAGSDGAFTILDSALYTALYRMEERRWVASEWGISAKGKSAKFYRLTAAGKAAHRAETAQWKKYVTAVTGVLAEPVES